jgi:RecA-family ATPase
VITDAPIETSSGFAAGCAGVAGANVAGPPLFTRRQSRFAPMTLAEMAELRPPAWLIEGLVPEDGLVVLYGEPGVGKSFVALDWGLSVATGTLWAGRKVTPGEVVYIYAEGVRGLTRRAEAWRQEHDWVEAPLFRAVPVAVPIPDDGERGEFVDAIRSVCSNPRLIIIDTLARNFGPGNESLAQDMNALVNGCEDLRDEFPGSTVLVVHHPGKDQTLSR